MGSFPTIKQIALGSVFGLSTFASLMSMSYSGREWRAARQAQKEALTEKHAAVLDSAQKMAEGDLATEMDIFALEMKGSFYYPSSLAGPAFEKTERLMKLNGFVNNFNERPENKKSGTRLDLAAQHTFKSFKDSFGIVVSDSSGTQSDLVEFKDVDAFPCGVQVKIL